MSRIVVGVLVIIAFGIGVGAGALGILYATGGTGTPSRDTNEVVSTLSLDAPTPTPPLAAQVATELVDINSQLDTISTQVANLNNGVVTVTDGDDGNENIEATEMVEPQAERVLFRINADESEARFMIDETLLGNSIVVTGRTNLVAGDIIVNFSDPASSQIGEIAINARTFRTDTADRDRSIRGQILQSAQDEFEFIIFAPTELGNLPSDAITIGDTVEFSIAGDLTIRDVTRQVTFEASVTLVSEDRIEVFATTQVAYADFGLTINPPPAVGGIGDILTLELDAVALQVQE